MKRIFIFVCLIFMVINVMAYQPMLVEGRIWTVLHYGGDTGIDSIDNLPPSTTYYKIDGDSIINGDVYKKIYSSPNKTNWKFDQLIMEDAEEGKVWKYDYSYWSQQSYKDLIFDFNTICKNIKYVKNP